MTSEEVQDLGETRERNARIEALMDAAQVALDLGHVAVADAILALAGRLH